jgi:diaminopimelate epimerase
LIYHKNQTQATVKFYKYQGTGNDFVMIDNRDLSFPKHNTALINTLCDRRFGIGADGLILLENDSNVDFKMVYFNADGNESSMCGNGGRCIVAFANHLKIIENTTHFIATDGPHFATILENGTISLQMKDVEEVFIHDNYVFLNTGSPHHVTQVDDLQQFDVKQNGKTIRYSDLYGDAGSKVNFVSQISDNHFAIRTYERGVEDETLSCGTGATAVAIAMNALSKSTSNTITIDVQGGQLVISFQETTTGYQNVFLQGAAQLVFEGQININL